MAYIRVAYKKQEHFRKISSTLKLNSKQTTWGVSQSAVFLLSAMTEMVKGALSCFAQWPLTNIKKYWDSMFWFMPCEDIINASKHMHKEQGKKKSVDR